MDWTVGQTVWLEAKRNNGQSPAADELRERTITKIGRKWVTIVANRAETKFERETGYVDNGGYGYRDRVWRSIEDFQKHIDRGQAWHELHQALRNQWQAPEHLSTEEIRAFLSRLRAEQADQNGTPITITGTS